MAGEARKCRWCATQPCPYESNEAFTKQHKLGGEKWLKEMPCWTPIRENVGDIYDAEGNLLVRQFAGEVFNNG